MTGLIQPGTQYNHFIKLSSYETVLKNGFYPQHHIIAGSNLITEKQYPSPA